MKVAKFGGSSLANGEQIKKVTHIVKNDPDIRAVVVSAPGKRNDEDTKITDMLIALFTNHVTGIDTKANIESILQRYIDITEELGLDKGIVDQLEEQLKTYLSTIEDPDYLLDALKSSGEDFNARIIAEYFNSVGITADYLSPKEAGITVTDQPGNASLITSSYDEIAKIDVSSRVKVIPGFFGYTEDGQIATFSRGGSDITGAIIARGLNVEAYENYTDQSYIYSAHPGIVAEPQPIKEISYREMRELAYSGFGIFHAEALSPLYEAKIPVVVRNTNDPDTPGTRIVAEREDTHEQPVIGVSAEEGYMSISLSHYLMNQEVGFLRRLLEIFEKYDISVEHMPTGIDDVSVIVRREQFKSQTDLDNLLSEVEKIISTEVLDVQENLAMAVVVGEGMKREIGTAQQATAAFVDAGVNLSMINQGASEISIFFTIDAADKDRAIKSLYEAFFAEEK